MGSAQIRKQLALVLHTFFFLTCIGPRSLYNHFMNRVHEARGSEGYGQSEAKDWHRRIYGGLVGSGLG